MGDNIYEKLSQRDYSHENVVHTASYYLFGHNTHFKLANHKTKAQAEVQERKEMALYKRFGANSYEEFIQIIKALFTPDFERDKEILASFSPASIEQDFEHFRTGALSDMFEKEIEIYFRYSEADKKLNKALKRFQGAIGKGDNVKIQGNLASIQIGFDNSAVGPIKKLLNDMYSEQLHYSNESFTSTLQTALAKKMATGEVNIIQSGTGQVVEELTHQIAIANFPWGYKQADIKRAIEDPKSQEAKNFMRAMYIVEEFVMNKCSGGSRDMTDAALAVYNKKIGDDPLNFRFFTGAGGGKSSMLKAIKGSLGEFQAALTFEYFARRLGKTTNIATIVGNLPAQGSELGKADLSLALDEIVGVQVKNWNEFMQQEIGTTIHPIEFAKTMEDGDDFLQFIANIFFNTTYRVGRESDYKLLEQELSQRIQELQNQDVVEGLSDKVSFYLIEGKYLVPASHLLRLMANANGSYASDIISISSKYKGMSDLEYRELTREGQNKWWIRDANGFWEPTKENEKTFKNLVGKDISLRTKMNLSGKLGMYNILGI